MPAAADGVAAPPPLLLDPAPAPSCCPPATTTTTCHGRNLIPCECIWTLPSPSIGFREGVSDGWWEEQHEAGFPQQSPAPLLPAAAASGARPATLLPAGAAAASSACDAEAVSAAATPEALMRAAARPEVASAADMVRMLIAIPRACCVGQTDRT